ncbi:MAG: histidine phosphatase family protein [Eubacteriales bacterium]
MKIYLIRHGQTEGNKDKRYLGITDEALCVEGKAEILNRVEGGCYPASDFLFVSPMKRCLETASIIFPEVQQVVVSDLRECDFGSFEYRNHAEMDGEKAYQEWIDSNGLLPFPGGESLLSFQKRCAAAFLETIQGLEKIMQEDKNNITSQNNGKDTKDKKVSFVIHGGTIMAIMSAFSNDPTKYFNYLCDNGRGYILDWEDGTCINIQSLQ